MNSAMNIYNDVIVFGITQADQDWALQAVFQKSSEVFFYSEPV